MKRKIIACLLTLTLILIPFSSFTSMAFEENPFLEADYVRKQAIELSNRTYDGQSSENLKTEEVTAAADKTKYNYVVRFKKETSFREIYECISKYQYQLLAQSSERVFAFNADNLDAFRTTYKKIIDYIGESKERTLTAVPNDTFYDQQWAIPDMNLPEAWDSTKGQSGVKVGVIDSGFYRGHEDFYAGTVLDGYDLTTNISKVTSDRVGHGTMVTSVIAAATNNSKGIAGACWNITVVPYKVAQASGMIESTDVIRAIYMAADDGCDVINISLGGYEQDPVEQAAVNYAVGKGCIIVAAAGNEGEPDDPLRGELSYPASNNGVISVAAVNRYNQRASFSQYNNMVDVCAPGEEIKVAIAEGTTTYATADGTSFSSPYVASVAALARSVDKSITADFFESLIQTTSTDLGTASKDVYHGWGLINAKNIVDKAAYPIICGVENNKVYTESRKIIFNKGTATLNGSSFLNGSTVSASGEYTLVVTDSAGKKSTTHFYIDKTILQVNGIENGRYYNTNRTITFSGGTASLNGSSFASGSTVNAEGTYTLIITGPYGATSTYQFTIDKTAPVVIGVSNGITYDSQITITFNEGTASLNGGQILSGTIVYAQGYYTLVVTDLAGNKTTISFLLSKGSSNKTEIIMTTDLTQWVLDQTSNQLCAISESGKSLLFINALTLNIDKTLSLESSPTDIIKDNGKLYITLNSSKKIVVVDIGSKVIEKTLNTTTPPYRIVKDGQKLYYVSNPFNEVHEFDLDNNTDTLLQLGYICSPDIAVNNELHMLYLGESGSTGSKLYYYSIIEKKIIGKAAYRNDYGYTFPERVTLYEGNSVYYAGRSFSAESPKVINGDFNGSQTVLASKLGCVFTSSSVYDQDTHKKLGDFTLPVNLVESTGSNKLYLYDKTNKKLAKYEEFNGAISPENINGVVMGIPAPQIPGTTQSSNVDIGIKELEMASELTQWVVDNTDNTLYAISKRNKALFIIDGKTLNILDTVFLKSGPTDIIIDEGLLYLSLDDVNQIIVFDTLTKAIKKTLYTSYDPNKIVKDGSKLYYVEADQHCDVFEFDLTTNTDKLIFSSAYYPDIAINPELHILYIGESGSTGNRLSYFDLVQYKLIGSSSDNYYFSGGQVLFDGAYVFYSGYAFDPENPKNIIGNYGSNEQIIQVFLGIVFTNKNIYDEFSFEKLDSWDAAVDLVLISDLFDIYTYDKVNKVITRYQGIEPFPEITGVADGGVYLDEVTISFDSGTALLDGQEFLSGTKVTALGEHELIVSTEYGESVTITFTIYKSIAGDSNPLTFPDENLKNALILSGIDSNGDEIISQGEMRIHKYFYLYDNGITNLTGMEYAVNAVDLDISYNVITDLSPIRSLKKLEYLDIGFNQISDISVLSGFTALTELYAYVNQISNITPLSSLTGLKTLVLDENKISDIRPLANLTGLGLPTVDPEYDYVFYGYLSLALNEISDISPLANLVNLTRLDLSSNQINDISALSRLTSLSDLILADNKISDIRPLSNLSALGKESGVLWMQNNQISDISPLSNLVFLTDIDLSYNPISNIEPLKDLQDLNYLSLAGIGLTDLNPLKNLSNLYMLDITDNQVSDISCLEKLTSLEGLYLAHNQISDISVLPNLTSLLGLDLSGNMIRYLSPIAELSDLMYLDVSGNRLEEIDALRNLDYLLFLNIADNEIADLSPIMDSYFFELDVSQNYLDLTSGSETMNYINSLLENDFTVKFEPQKDISLDIPPVITINSYNTQPTNQNITVTVTSDKGKLNAESHTFTGNGSFDFIATDSAGKSTKVTVTITNIDKTAPVVTGVSSGGSYLDEVTISFNEGTATIDGIAFTSGGKITQKGNHTIKVTDAAGNVTQFSFTITRSVKSVNLNKATLSLDYGNSETLTATINPTDASNKNVTWKSSNESVASVDQTGKVTALRSGTATITATTTDGNKTASCTVTVIGTEITVGTGSYLSLDQTTNLLSGLKPKTTLDYLKSQVFAGSGALKIINAAGQTISDGSTSIGTGTKIQQVSSSNVVTDEITVVVLGDISGDAAITITDLLKLKAFLLKRENLSGAYAKAADINKDGNITITDFVKIKADLLNREKIHPMSVSVTVDNSTGENSKTVYQPENIGSFNWKEKYCLSAQIVKKSTI